RRAVEVELHVALGVGASPSAYPALIDLRISDQLAALQSELVSPVERKRKNTAQDAVGQEETIGQKAVRKDVGVIDPEPQVSLKAKVLEAQRLNRVGARRISEKQERSPQRAVIHDRHQALSLDTQVRPWWGGGDLGAGVGARTHDDRGVVAGKVESRLQGCERTLRGAVAAEVVTVRRHVEHVGGKRGERRFDERSGEARERVGERRSIGIDQIKRGTDRSNHRVICEGCCVFQKDQRLSCSAQIQGSVYPVSERATPNQHDLKARRSSEKILDRRESRLRLDRSGSQTKIGAGI